MVNDWCKWNVQTFIYPIQHEKMTWGYQRNTTTYGTDLRRQSLFWTTLYNCFGWRGVGHTGDVIIVYRKCTKLDTLSIGPVTM
jgi:hypothetical protein